MTTTPVHQSTVPRKPGLILGTVELCLGLLGLLFGSLVFSIVLEIAGMLWLWPAEGLQHSQAMFQHELGMLDQQFEQSLVLRQPTETVDLLADNLHRWLANSIDRNTLLARPSPSLKPLEDGKEMLFTLYQGLRDYLLAAYYTTLVFVVRMLVLGLSTPLYLLATITGGVDGLVRRDLRKFGAGRESSFVYHRARRTVRPLLFVPWVIYLSLPVSVHPLWILLPSAAALGVMTAITMATFKKYL